MVACVITVKIQINAAPACADHRLFGNGHGGRATKDTDAEHQGAACDSTPKLKQGDVAMKRLLSLIALAATLAACSDASFIDSESFDHSQLSKRGDDAASSLKVMTRNMYVGANVDRIIEEPDPSLVPIRVAEEWARLQATDYPGRARAIAQEIVDNRPHLVGLQEVSLFRIQDPADLQLNATDVALDFLPILLNEIESAGGDYRVVGLIEDTDVEIPRLNTDFSLTDVRLTDYDVVLARADVEVDNVSTVNYQAYVPIPGISIKRGYVALDATVKGKTYRFVSTHLEPSSTYDGYFQALQAQELIATLAPEERPLIVVGDFNAFAPESPVYQAFLSAGYEDAWTLIAGDPGTGLTCCHVPDLDNALANFDRRIDLILFRNTEEIFSPGDGSIHGEVIGEEPTDKTDSGLWPSDHAGVVVRFQFASPAS